MVPPDEPTGADANAAEIASKTRRKHQMHELQALGEALIALDRRRLAEMDLPERLLDAVLAAQGITKHEARRRQLQFVGRIMRDVDPDPIRATLERWARVPNAEKAHFAEIERWRDRLVGDDAALDDYVAAHPGAPRAEIAVLATAARAERARGGPPRKFRELFRFLKALDPPVAGSADE